MDFIILGIELGPLVQQERALPAAIKGHPEHASLYRLGEREKPKEIIKDEAIGGHRTVDFGPSLMISRLSVEGEHLCSNHTGKETQMER